MSDSFLEFNLFIAMFSCAYINTSIKPVMFQDCLLDLSNLVARGPKPCSSGRVKLPDTTLV